ncbi:kinase-like protein [Fistulina hepatica ATCC 64428]|uniref:Kinase-like protein n=1 Tax=Fistulina hepatica ATCC 64428 TaxID=1128425 RepID=A0A0D7A8D1_9AGAR|nr:kinase-like protein [Fistulina hepatica ATCC 64428]
MSGNAGGGYGDVRASIDVASLNRYLATHVPAVQPPVAIKQFKFGQSNPTYLLTDACRQRFVLRKKPAGALLSKTAHQIEREYTVLHALHTHNCRPSTTPDQRVPVPEPFVLCRDVSVIGTPFYIMEFLDGRLFTDPTMPSLSPKDRRQCWLSAVRSLAALSSLSPSAIGLDSYGPHTPYFPRQIKSLSKISAAQASAVDVDTKEPVGNIPRFHEMITWYSNHLPDENKTGLRVVHGDYKLDNLMFHPTENRVIGILDWELSTLGSPLVDFANLTQPWLIDSKRMAEENPSVRSMPNVFVGFRGSANPEPISVEELEREYCHITKYTYPIREMTFVRSWMLFRLSIIAQGIAARHARRQASSAMAESYGELFPVIGDLAIGVLEESIGNLNEKSKL